MATRSTHAEAKATTAAAQPPAALRPLTDTERAELAVYTERRRTRRRPPRFGSNSGSDRPADTQVVLPAAGVNVDLFRARLANVVGTIDELAIGQLLSQAAYAVEGKD